MSVTASEILEQAGKQQNEITELRAKLRESAKVITQNEQEINRLRKQAEDLTGKLAAASVEAQAATDLRAEAKALAAENARLYRDAEKNEPLLQAVREFARVVRGA